MEMTMSTDESLVELKEIVGALILASRHPLTLAQIRANLRAVAETDKDRGGPFATARETDVRAAIEQLLQETRRSGAGFRLVEVAAGYRFQSDERCGPWLKHLLHVEKPHRLSRPALETLAIIAYRQPLTRLEIEGVRGVNVDHILRVLMEMQLIHMVGRSKLAGRPMLFGTTKRFLEHFGLGDLKQLPGIEQLARIDRHRADELAQSENTGEDVPDTAEADEADEDAKQPEKSATQETVEDVDDDEFDEDDEDDDE
jgi:segregation and condensation protein B